MNSIEFSNETTIDTKDKMLKDKKNMYILGNSIDKNTYDSTFKDRDSSGENKYNSKKLQKKKNSYIGDSFNSKDVIRSPINEL
jgi:hypothetical protein